MADFAADAPASAGTTTTERSGAAAATDTVPAGATLLVRNTGAGTHTLVLGIGYQFDGLPVGTAGTRVISFPASAIKVVRVPANYGDSNGRVPINVGEAAQSEVKYYVIGA